MVLAVTVGSEGSRSDALKGAASKVEISLLSNYPKHQREHLQAWRITVDAREKELPTAIMHYYALKLQVERVRLEL